MKKGLIIIFVFFVFFFSNSVASQGFGIRGGVNFSTVSGGEIPEVGSVTGYYGGVYYQMSIIKDLFYFQPELQYTSQGFSITSDDIKTDYSLDYVTVPLILRVYFLKLFSFEAGPQLGFNVNDSFDVEDLNGETVESFDPTLALGLNINLPLHISIDFRYVYGFNEVISNTEEKNQVFQTGVSFRF